MADVQHLAGNNQETDRGSINDVVSQRTLREIYLPAFEAAVTKGDVATAMCAYNKINGAYSCQNSSLMQDVFKNEYQFRGFIRSDLGAVHDVGAAYNAGMDQSKPQHNAELEAGVQAGSVPISRIDDAVSRVLREMFRFGLFERQPTGTPDTVVTSPQHAASARDIAEQGAVLLKNADNALPLPATTKSIAVIGPDGGDQAYTAGGGSSHVQAPYVVTPYQGIKNRAGSGVDVTYTQGLEQGAVQAAKNADVAIVFANDVEREGADRPDLSLPSGQDDLIAAVASANPNTVVVLNTGSAVTMPWLSGVKAVVEGWYAGQEDGNVLAALLFGDVNPSGKLPITFPRSEADTPAHTPQQWPGVNGDADYSEGLQVGYRWYDAQGIAPLFPFGYGLSYTTFAVSHLVIGPKQLAANGHETVSADVTNTGARTGAEVVQLYVGLPASTNEPPKQLKGYRKVSLKPGQTRRVSFELAPGDLSYWDDNSHGWVLAGGSYRIMVGTSSQDIAATDTFTVAKPVGPRYVKTTAPEILDAGSTSPATTTFTNDSAYAVHNVRIALPGPSGWTVMPSSPASFQTVLAGQSVTTTWQLTASAGVRPASYPLTATATYQAAEGGTGSRSDAATVSVPYPSVGAAFDNVGITDDADHTPGNFDGSGNSYSAQALAAVGITPGAAVPGRGVAFTWPDVPSGVDDNATMRGQLIDVSGSGSVLGILGAGVSGTQAGTGTVYYTDGSTQLFTLTWPDWFATAPVAGDDLIATTAYLNRTNGKPPHTASLFAAYLPLSAGKSLRAVALPDRGDVSMHAFAMAVG